MKRLCLIRSAKGSWEDPLLADMERELSAKGREAAKTIASYLLLKGIEPDLILSSCAMRAQQTAEIVANPWEEEKPVAFFNELYQSSVERMLEMIAVQDDETQTLFLIAHAPQIHELAHRLTHEAILKFPAGGVACVELPIESWEETLKEGVGRLEFFIYPKQFKHFMPSRLRP
ncbi:MAG: histidine phosphatase [Epsilonproteobacteria bacterium]|nr:histidine phosphatase [Campylobacterota bacterium]